jgi:hypothetical protein
MTFTPRTRLASLRCNIELATWLVGGFIGAMLAVSAGCGGGGATTCTTDNQCDSHFCRADGTCAPTGVDAGSADSSVIDDAPGDGAIGLCTPNHDGTITSTELPLAAGRSANFRVATTATVDTAGTASGTGMRAWDFSTVLSGDADKTVTLLAPAGAWWAADYPTATYAAPLSSTADTLGVFNVSATGVTLLAVVSPSGGLQATNLKYTPPALILKLPFAVGATWTSTSTISGTYQGVTSAGLSEKYTSRADEVGTVKTPYGEFPTLRVATDLVRQSFGVTILTKRTFAFEVECFGTVATLVSQDNETAAEFTKAAEVRRLAP